jgi:hypothetical protein
MELLVIAGQLNMLDITEILRHPLLSCSEMRGKISIEAGRFPTVVNKRGNN